MKIILKITIVFLFVFFGCNSNQHEKIIAKLDNYSISINTVDSILEPQINQLRSQVVEGIISRKIIEQEASNVGISAEEYVYREVDSKLGIITTNDENTLFVLKRKRFEFLIDSLKFKYYVSYFLNHFDDPSKFLIHYRGNLNSEITFIIISDFDCPACKWFEQHFQDSYKKYSKDVKFGYIFYGDKVSLASLSAEAADKQNKFWDMHDSLFLKQFIDIENELTYINLAKDLKLNVSEFKSDLNRIENKNMVQQNLNRLFSYGIRQTPTFILNNKILPEGIKIDSLKKLIELKIKQK